jgi:transposase
MEPGRLTHVGSDGAATTLAVVVRPAGGRPAPAATVATTPAGWQDLTARLGAAGGQAATTRLVMEATGSDWVGVATALTTAGWTVSVVRAASARDSATATRRRATTDAVDAAVLAAYGRALKPAAWRPPPPAVQALQLRVRQRDDLVTLRTATTHRQHALAHRPAVPAEVVGPLAAVVTVLDEPIAALAAAIKRRALAAAAIAAEVGRLDAIPGVGLLTAAIVVTEVWVLGAELTPDQAVAHAGLDPAPHQSGSSVRGAGHSSKTGNARFRQALSMVALSASRFNPQMKAFYERLVGRGKQQVVAVVAVARKLLTVMVTLMKQGRSYDRTWTGRPAAD